MLVDGKPLTYLCHCDGPLRKPYCNGTHRKIGFKAPEAYVETP